MRLIAEQAMFRMRDGQDSFLMGTGTKREQKTLTN